MSTGNAGIARLLIVLRYNRPVDFARLLSFL